MIGPNMVYLRGEHTQVKGQICRWCNLLIRQDDRNNGTLAFGPPGTQFYVHKLCAPSWVSVHAPSMAEELKILIE